MDDVKPEENRAVAATQATESRVRDKHNSSSAQASYYNVSILKSPVWKWEIAAYFFLGGLSSGAYTIARIAERSGGEKYRALTRAGTYAAFASMLPCPGLLIHDLGDPKRFHHMLRVFKPSSPMSLGTWMLTAYGGAATVAVLREYLRADPGSPIARSRASDVLRGTLLAVHDAAGVPLALGVMGYTGVLLSCTANPMWCKNPWLGPLFTASAFGTGAAATSLMLDWRNEGSRDEHRALNLIDSAARVAEVITLAGYFKHAGEKARPLTHGKMKSHMAVAVGSLIASEVLKRLPVDRRHQRLTRIASSVATLVGGFSMRWAMVYGGHEAAKDPHLARLATNDKRSTPRRMNADRRQLPAQPTSDPPKIRDV